MNRVNGYVCDCEWGFWHHLNNKRYITNVEQMWQITADDRCNQRNRAALYTSNWRQKKCLSLAMNLFWASFSGMCFFISRCSRHSRQTWAENEQVFPIPIHTVLLPIMLTTSFSEGNHWWVTLLTHWVFFNERNMMLHKRKWAKIRVLLRRGFMKPTTYTHRWRLCLLEISAAGA